MGKCASCGNRVSAGRELCLACEAKRDDPKSTKDLTKEHPSGRRFFQASEDFVDGLARIDDFEQDASKHYRPRPGSGLPACPQEDCEGLLRPRNCFLKPPYWTCDTCKNCFDDATGDLIPPESVEAAKGYLKLIRGEKP